jgi:hypothetical protein
MPQVLGNIEPLINQYEVLCDLDLNLHVFYIATNNTNRIEYKKFVYLKQLWQEILPLHINSNIKNNFSCTIDNKNNIFLILQKNISPTSNPLIIKHFKPRENISDEHTLSNLSSSYKYIEIISIMNNLIICCVDVNNILYINTLENFKYIPENSHKISIQDFSQAHYKSTYPFESFEIKKTFFYIKNGLHIPFLKKIDMGNIYKKNQSDEMTMLKAQIANLEKTLYYKNMELEKIISKIKLLENKK